MLRPPPATPTPVVNTAVTPIARPVVTAAPVDPTSSSTAILSFDDENIESFLSEFSEAEQSCIAANVDESHLGSIQVAPYKHSVPEDVWLHFLQCLGDDSLVRLVFTQFRDQFVQADTGGYFDNLGNQTWDCISVGFAALEMSDLVVSNPSFLDLLPFAARYLMTPCLSDGEWADLLERGLESDTEGVELANYRCLTEEYGGVEGIGGELKYFLANPRLDHSADERGVAFGEAAARCGLQT